MSFLAHSARGALRILYMCGEQFPRNTETLILLGLLIALWQVLLNHDGDFLSNTIYKPFNLGGSFLNARSTEALFSILIAVEK